MIGGIGLSAQVEQDGNDGTKVGPYPVWGVGLASFSAVLFCWLADSLGRDLDRIQVSAMLIPLVFAISNTSVHSALTSNGGLLVILLLYLMPRSYSRSG